MTFVNKNLIIIIVIEIRMEMLAEILWLARVKLHMRESFCSDSPAHPPPPPPPQFCIKQYISVYYSVFHNIHPQTTLQCNTELYCIALHYACLLPCAENHFPTFLLQFQCGVLQNLPLMLPQQHILVHCSQC